MYCSTEKQTERAFGRYLGAVIIGVLGGFILVEAVGAGVKLNYKEEVPLDTWGILYWGEHYVIRALWSFVGIAWGAFLAGLIARRKGPVVGIITAVPTIVVWLVGLYFWAIGQDILLKYGYDSLSLGNKVITVLIPVAIIPISLLFGTIGETLAEKVAPHFIKKHHSLLGIKWYHHIWIPIPLYAIVVQTAWVIDYGLGWLRISFEDLYSIIPNLFLFAILATLYLTWIGLSRAYDCLSNYSREYSPTETARGVLKYGIGFPLLAAIAQLGIILLHYGISKLLG